MGNGKHDNLRLLGAINNVEWETPHSGFADVWFAVYRIEIWRSADVDQQCLNSAR